MTWWLQNWGSLLGIQTQECIAAYNILKITQVKYSLGSVPFDQTNSLVAISGSNVCLHTSCDDAPHGTSTPDNPYLRTWMTPPNARSFESFSSSPASFGPSTPIDRPYSPWQSPLSEIDHSIALGSEASSEDLHMRSHSEVRKAEEVTVQRKFVRKLRAALVAIRLASN
ncbi:hypothetical protein BDV93DRAFT_591782 [Ceratobasidium sp. AG-I]|nr:hypothetical protein BDV93DRAFT_591782 [Ceratobasidium sp. AG-I]